MITQNLIQGSPEWLAYRPSHDNASDAPAMMGCSSYKTRDQLIAELATGITPEVDPATQRLYDSGHRFEKLARPLADPHLEALRRFASKARHRCEAIREEDIPALVEAGYTAGQAHGLTGYLAGRQSRGAARA